MASSGASSSGIRLTLEEEAVIAKNRAEAIARRNKRMKIGVDAMLQPVPSESPFSRGSVLSTSYKPSTSSLSSISTSSRPNTGWVQAAPKSGPLVSRSQSSASTMAINSSSKGIQGPKVAPIFNVQPVTVMPLKAKIELKEGNKLTLDFPFNHILIETIKKIKSAKYVPGEKKWKVDIKEYLGLVEEFNRLAKNNILKLEIDSESVPAKVVSLVLSEGSQMDMPVDLTDKLPPFMFKSMFNFQKEGVRFGIRKNGRCLIADDMGLGKTIQALGIAWYYRQDWPMLIVCPASVCDNWRNEVLKWLPDVKKWEVGVYDKHYPDSQVKIIILSYDKLGKVIETATQRKTNFIIMDESHNIKSHDAQRTQSALRIAHSVKRIILLSGTPALSRPMELHTQISAINNKLFPKKHEFGMRYCNATMRFQGFRGRGGFRPQAWDYRGSSNSEELKVLLESTIMIRRLKKDVLSQLPKKKRVVVNLVLNLDEEAQAELDKLASKTEKSAGIDYKAALMEWYHETAKHKVPAVVEYLDQKLQKTNKLICFCYHKVLVEAVVEFLISKCIYHIVITGDTPQKLRQTCCDYFQNDAACRVAVVSIVAAGVGITLTAANDVIFTELFWNPGILCQAEDRAHRIGQQKQVTIEYLLSPRTVDECIWSIIEKKLEVLNKVGVAKDTMKNSAIRSSDQPTLDSFFKALSKDIPDDFKDEFGDSVIEEEPEEKEVEEVFDDSFDSDVVIID